VIGKIAVSRGHSMLGNCSAMFATASHLVIDLIGAVLLYSSVISPRNRRRRSTEPAREAIWVDIDDLSKAALSRQTAFLQQISAMTNSGLSGLFGVKLLSAGAVATSVCFSVGSVLLFATTSKHAPVNNIALLIARIISFLVGLSPIPFRYLGLLWIPGSIFFSLYVDRGDMGWEWTYWINEFLPLLIILGGGFLSDVLFIAVSRWCLRTASELKNIWKIAILLTLSGCLGLVLISLILWGHSVEI
jgi:hypothetical protein